MIALSKRPLALIALLAAIALAACTDKPIAADQVRAFCDAIGPDEPFAAVEGRFPKNQLQPGGFAPDPKERLAQIVPEDQMRTISTMLLEPSGAASDERPVCAIYYSDPVRGGDGRVVLAEFKPAWRRRF